MNNGMDHYNARYNLGPNGGILTALNLFTTKFDQVLDLVEKRAETVEYVFVILFSTRSYFFPNTYAVT
jgi:hypothetical protein